MTIAQIEAETRSLCDADTVSYPAATILRRENVALEEAVGEIILIDGLWQFDDTNYTTTPRGQGTLISGQISYSFADEFLTIEEVDILDTSGNYRKVQPFDAKEAGMSFEEYFGITFAGSTYTAPVGFPTHYDKNGDTILLSHSPTATNVTLTKGIKVLFQRTASIITSDEQTTGTKVPGIASPFHIFICYHSAIPYCMSYKKDRVALYEKKKDEVKAAMLKYYTKRPKDEKHIMEVERVSFR